MTNTTMKDYHTHQAVPQGGYLCSVTREDWPRVAEQTGMTPCFGIHPRCVEGVDAAQLAFDLDEWLTRYPQADVGEVGLDGTDRFRASLEQQELLLRVELGAAFRHDRMAHLHGAGAWGRLLELLRERERAGALPRVLLHAWGGSHEMAREFLRLGAIFSVGLRELMHPKAAERYARIPAGHLFPESDDCPESWPRTLELLHALRPDVI